MKKLVVLIAVLGAVVLALRMQASGSPNSPFNRGARYSLGKYTPVRWLLGLHEPGDAKLSYLTGNSPLVVEVVSPELVPISQDAVNRFVREVKEVLGRPVELYTVDTIDRGTLSEADLERIVSERRRHVKPAQPNFFVVYAEHYAKLAGSSAASLPIGEFGLIISDSRIHDLTTSYPQARDDYTLSQLLYGFGRQLGIPVTDSQRCAVSTAVSRPDSAVDFSGSNIAHRYCDEERTYVSGYRNK